MHTPRRRSSRLMSQYGTPSCHRASPAVSKFAAIIERDSTPNNEQSLDAIVSSTTPHKTMPMPGSFLDDAPLRTPQSQNRRPHPDHGEMHPSKIQRSTTKEPGSGLRLGFTDIKPSNGPSVPAVDATPSKCHLPPSAENFDFKWARPCSDLSEEAQRIMESVREEAARIKEKMQAERREQAMKDEEAHCVDGDTNVAQRKFAKPKGKSRRFSDAHRAEFRKMDSIANHPSTWKSKVVPRKDVSLKRSESKAGFGEVTTPLSDNNEECLESPSRGKRVKTSATDDVSVGRSSSKDGKAESFIPRPQSGLPSAVTTPTKASLARAANVKSAGKLNASSLPRSKTSREIGAASKDRATKDTGSTALSPLRKVASMKSILVKPQVKYSDDPLKIAAGTHIPVEGSKTRSNPDLGKELPSLPTTPTASPSRIPTTKKVGFSSSTKLATEDGALPRSPSKIPSLSFQAPKSELISSPTKSTQVKKKDVTESATYPKLGQAPEMKNPRPLSSHPPGASFTFRSSLHPISFGPVPNGPDSATYPPLPTPSLVPEEMLPLEAAGNVARQRRPLKTIRHVRPSGIATPVSAFDKMSTVPHGMPNKKRRRIDESEGDDGFDTDAENQPPPEKGDERAASPAKRLKTMPGVANLRKAGQDAATTTTAVVVADAKGGSKVAGEPPKRRKLFKSGKQPGGDAPAKRKGLSLSRLNLLARPKNRG